MCILLHQIQNIQWKLAGKNQRNILTSYVALLIRVIWKELYWSVLYCFVSNCNIRKVKLLLLLGCRSKIRALVGRQRWLLLFWFLEFVPYLGQNLVEFALNLFACDLIDFEERKLKYFLFLSKLFKLLLCRLCNLSLLSL